MEPNLLIGDHLLVNKFVAAPTLTKVEDTLLPIEAIHRGDVIVFKHPKMPERDLIKRTIGLPGETLELRERRVYINGKPLDEPYAHFLFKTPPTSLRGTCAGTLARSPSPPANTS
jgi:signal peptidase I